MRRIIYVAVAVLATLILALPARAQTQTTTGVIQGTVTDTSGAVLPGVNVEARNLDTNLTRSLVTDRDGRFAAGGEALAVTGANGKRISALLYTPDGVTAQNKAPGVLAVHGYINSRETQSGFAIESDSDCSVRQGGQCVISVTGGISDGKGVEPCFGHFEHRAEHRKETADVRSFSPRELWTEGECRQTFSGAGCGAGHGASPANKRWKLSAELR